MISDKTREEFEKLRAAFPEWTASKQPVGSGSFGVVVEDIVHGPVPAVTKIFFQHPTKERSEAAKVYLADEVAALRILGGPVFEGVQLPKLVGEPNIINHAEYFACFSMTKVRGVTANWIDETALEALPPEPEQHFYAAGRLLGHFHTYATERARGHRVKLLSSGAKVEQVESFGDRKNQTLREADRYLQSNKVASIVHGDYHGWNLHVDEANRTQITGLLDFSHTAFSENAATDFLHIPLIMMPHAVTGYREVTGRHIESQMVTITRIAGLTRFINRHADDPAEREEAESALHGQIWELDHPSVP